MKFITLTGLLTAIICIGCKDEQKWSTVEVERRRIAADLVASGTVSADKKDEMFIIVFDRPRTKTDTQATGYQNAVTRVKRERIALAAAESKLFSNRRSISNPSGQGEIPDEIVQWRASVRRAQRLLLVAEAVQSSDDWLSVFDVLIGEQLQNTPSKIPQRTLREPESLRLARARDYFAKWLVDFEEVLP